MKNLAPIEIKRFMKSINIFFIILLAACFNACTKELGTGCSNGAGSIEKRVVDIEPITKIDLQLEGNLFISQGEQFIEIEAPSDIIDLILQKSEVGSDRWTIKIDDCYDGPEINIWATLPNIQALDISGSGNITTLDTLQNLESLNLEIDGSGDMNVQLTTAQKLDMEIKGSGNIVVDAQNVTLHSYDINGSGDIRSNMGEAETSRFRIQGSGNIEAIGSVDANVIEIEGQGNIKAFNLCSRTCDIKIQGSGDCNVKVIERLNVDIEGSGDVCYKGQPSVTLNNDGSGNVTDCN